MENNVKQAVPFFTVRSMSESLAFYVDGLGFALKDEWIERGTLRWCWLELGAAAVMLQEARPGERDVSVPVGEGVTIYFMCNDALVIYRRALDRGLTPTEPFVGNAMWVTSVTDPDGFLLHFESATDVPEETRLSEVRD